MIDWKARAAAYFHENAPAPHRQNPRNDVSEVSAVGGGAVLTKDARPQSEAANDSTSQGCDACRHLTQFGNCGEPVAAGLSAVFRLESHPAGGVGCAVFEGKSSPIDHRIAALLDSGLLDADDVALIRQRYTDAASEWDQLLDEIEHKAWRAEQ